MELNKFKTLLFEKALSEGFGACEVYFTKTESLSISTFAGEIDKYSLNKSQGLSFRGLFNEKMGYSFTEIVDEESIDMLINKAKESAQSIDSEDVEFIYEGDKEYPEASVYSKDLEAIDADKMIEVVLDLEKQTKAYSDKVVNIAHCSIVYGAGESAIYNTKGLSLENKSNSLYAYVMPIVADNNQNYDGMGYDIVSSIDKFDTKKIAKDAVEKAFEKVNATSIDSGKYKTIIRNDAMESLLSTYAGVFSAEATQKGLSLLKDKEGEMIASSAVTIVDDPLLKDGLATTGFDDEGVATYTKEVVSNGKLTTLLYNLKTAHKANKKSTGNGFKGGYASPVKVSTSNFYIKPGEKSFDELVKEIGEGLVVTSFAGLHSGANSITGDFSLAANGFFVKDGKVDFAVEQITVSGNFFTLIKDIVEVGSDLLFPISATGAPSVYVKELSVAGK